MKARRRDLIDFDTLPPPPAVCAVRWVVARKAAVVRAVERGDMSADAACALYVIAPEELAAWRAGYAGRGLDGLRVAR